MSKLVLYTVFHANLNYSYISSDLYPQILRRCYWPILRIIESQQVPLGLEFSAYTLQTINELDATFASKLRDLWDRGLCEVIGSGFVQSIMPLMPAKVNRENLRIGNEIYEKILGRKPKLAFINEQVFSASLPDLYREAGFEGLIANWEGALPAHSDPELIYTPCAVETQEGAPMPIVWHSLDAYRGFQQYVENEIPLETFLERLHTHLPEGGVRSYQLYGSDWEVFDFKPWRVHPEGFQEDNLGEMERISGLLELLKGDDRLEIVTPSEVISQFSSPPVVHPECPENPLPYKKQRQHSVSRWAVGGRDNVRLNTQCYKLYQILQFADWRLGNAPGDPTLSEEVQWLWKELCFLWGSDFRSFTTEDKFLEFRNRMGAAMGKAEQLCHRWHPAGEEPGQLSMTNCSTVSAGLEPIRINFSVNGLRNGPTPIKSRRYELVVNGETSPCQVSDANPQFQSAERLELEAMPPLMPAQTAEVTINESSTTRNQEFRIDSLAHEIETPSVRLRLIPSAGGAIQSLAFPGVCDQPLICHNEWPGVESLASFDAFLSGDLVAEDRMGRKISDHSQTTIQYPEQGHEFPIYLPVRCQIHTELGTIWKTYRVYLHQPRVDLMVRFQWKDLVPKYFRLGRMAVNPEAFQRSSLYYATTNGGNNVERFPLNGTRVFHDQPAGENLSATSCVGATEGWLIIGDQNVGLGLVTRPGALYSVPLLNYQEPGDDGQEFRLTVAHSLDEQDETSHTLWRGHSTWALSLIAGTTDIIQRTRASALLANGGLVAHGVNG